MQKLLAKNKDRCYTIAVMTKYQYKTMLIDVSQSMFGGFDTDRLDNVLNSMGAKGWELIAVESSGNFFGGNKLALVFKRIAD